MERKLKRFNILLDDESLLYFPGSFLTGKVLLELEENTPATGLYFHIIGEGVVRLEAGKRASAGKKWACERENYIDFRMRLLGDGPTGAKDARDSDSDSDSCLTSSSSSRQREDDHDEAAIKERPLLVLSPGVHTFPFKLGLPASLPSTFLGSHGWVQYFCRAVLREPSGLVHKNQQVFIIINPVDLNLEPASLQQPFYCEAEERVAGRACSRASGGLLACRVRLDRAAFVPGESILVSATIDNSSGTAVKRTRAVLAETVEYRAAGGAQCQSETRELASVEGQKVAAKSTGVWRKEPLAIPALPPTNLRGCHLIKIHYELLFQMLLKGTRKPVELRLPIVMATYPVRNADGTLRRRKGASYPDQLPMARPWLGATTK